MKIITERDRIKSWFETFKNDHRKHMNEVRKILNPETCTGREIAEVMIKHGIWNRGCLNDMNNAWFLGYCDECEKASNVLIQVGQEPDYDSSTAEICFDCLKKAAELAGFTIAQFSDKQCCLECGGKGEHKHVDGWSVPCATCKGKGQKLEAV